ncbi:hypothetical protein STENM223S_03101 [Streptomyces tendae]
MLHDSGRYSDTAMPVVIGDPLLCTAVAVGIAQLHLDRFDGAKLVGPVDTAAMTRVDAVLRAVQDLQRATEQRAAGLGPWAGRLALSRPPGGVRST